MLILLYLHLFSAKLGDGNQNTYAFDKKGVLYIPREGLTLEAAEDIAIETGAEEVEEHIAEDETESYKVGCTVNLGYNGHLGNNLSVISDCLL